MRRPGISAASPVPAGRTLKQVNLDTNPWRQLTSAPGIEGGLEDADILHGAVRCVRLLTDPMGKVTLRDSTV